MGTSQFRKGNYVIANKTWSNLPIGTIEIEDVLHNTGFNMSEQGQVFYDIEDCQPILITPDVLRTCVGAIIVEEDGNVIVDDEEKIISELENASRRKIFELNIKGGFRLHVDLIKKECRINHAVTVRDFQYLHQLQNLIFCLSGKELEINQNIMQ